jgi:hypothetical protein
MQRASPAAAAATGAWNWIVLGNYRREIPNPKKERIAFAGRGLTLQGMQTDFSGSNAR